jgi:hypothetical protein
LLLSFFASLLGCIFLLSISLSLVSLCLSVSVSLSSLLLFCNFLYFFQQFWSRSRSFKISSTFNILIKNFLSFFSTVWVNFLFFIIFYHMQQNIMGEEVVNKDSPGLIRRDQTSILKLMLAPVFLSKNQFWSKARTKHTSLLLKHFRAVK